MLFYLNLTDKSSLEPVKATILASIGWKEKEFEDLLAKHMQRLIREEDLFVIAQERQMQEEPDIMALDSDGRLYLFELKRWKSSAESVLQVLRYGQRFGQFRYQDLQYLFHSHLRKRKAVVATAELPGLADAHADYFERNEKLNPEDFNRAQTFVLVTNGLDRESRQAIEYWHSRNVPIRSLIYRLFKTSEGTVLLEFDPFSPYPETLDEPDEGVFVVNTNISFEPTAWREMLDESKVAAYGDKKYAVTRIRKGSAVCLYHSKVGIIAIGRAAGEYRQKEFGGEPDAEFFVPCDFEVKVDPYKEPEKALPASALNKKFGTGHKFHQTVYTLPKEYYSFIQSELRRRQE